MLKKCDLCEYYKANRCNYSGGNCPDSVIQAYREYVMAETRSRNQNTRNININKNNKRR